MKPPLKSSLISRFGLGVQFPKHLKDGLLTCDVPYTYNSGKVVPLSGPDAVGSLGLPTVAPGIRPSPPVSDRRI